MKGKVPSAADSSHYKNEWWQFEVFIGFIGCGPNNECVGVLSVTEDCPRGKPILWNTSSERLR